jgi:hypothetical protein
MTGADRFFADEAASVPAVGQHFSRQANGSRGASCCKSQAAGLHDRSGEAI